MAPSDGTRSAHVGARDPASPDAPDPCARAVLDAVPLVMRHIRAWMRAQPVEGLSVPQFRALALLSRHPGGLTLGDVAEFLGLSPAGASRMIQSLVNKQLVARDTHAVDRRQLALTLTPAGEAALAANRKVAEAKLAATLASLSEADRADVTRAMAVLSGVFAGDDPKGA